MATKCGYSLFAFILLFLLTAAPSALFAQDKNTTVSTTTSTPTGGNGSVTRGGITIPAEKVNPIKIPRIETAPKIDGDINEEIWKQAYVLKDFIQIGPGDNIAPSKATEVLIAFDAKTLYMAFRCFDEKDKIRATVGKRDEIFGEDNVRVFLDTFNDQRRAYMVGFNPLGIQADGIYTDDQGTDFNVDIVMESKGIITEFGWSVEVAIPFKSLRYQAGKDKMWGMHVWRNIDRFSDEIDSWMPISRHISGQMSQMGKITGLEGISTERTLEVIPSMTLKEEGNRQPDGRILNGSIKPDLGVTVKYSITPNITLDAAVNPDFADVEADAPVVSANQRFEIFFPEKRPFFLEGVDIFRTPIQAVYTRRIFDPDVAAKLTGKIGKNTFGIMYASDRPAGFGATEDPNANVSVIRLKRDMGKENHVGFLGTTYNFIIPTRDGDVERHNYVGGFDGRFKLDSKTIFTFQALGSNSKRFFYSPDFDDNVYRNGNGFAYNVSYDYTSKLFGYQIGSSGQTKDYRSDVGFTRRFNSMNHYFGTRFSSEPKPKAAIIEKSLNTSVSLNNDFQGRIQNWWHDISFNVRMQRNFFLNGGGGYGYERVFEEEFGAKRTPTREGAFFGGDPERSTYKYGYWAGIESNFTKRFSFFFYGGRDLNVFDFDFGGGLRYPRVSPAALAFGQGIQLDPGAGKSMWIDAGFDIKPLDQFNISFNYEKNNLRRNDTGLLAYDSNIFSTRATYQFTRFVFARAIVDYDTLSSGVGGQYLFGWTPNPGTALYVGYNDDLNYKGFNRFTDEPERGLRLYQRTFFIKMSYLFRKSF